MEASLAGCMIVFAVDIRRRMRSCPADWCSFCAHHAFRLGPGADQLAAAGRLMSGSSLIAAIVSRVMYLDRWTAHSSFCSSSRAPTRRTMTSSLGKILTTSVRRLISPFSRSMGFVTGIRFLVPKFGCGILARGVWCDHPGQRHREHEGAGRPMHTMSCELVLVAGRLYDSPGCAASANP